MTYNSFREKDMQMERILADYLDANLYCQNIFQEVRRTNTIEDQLDGSDLTLSIPNKNVHHVIVDEKAQLYYLDGGLPTFAFELNFINKAGERVEGWLTDSKKKTQYYQLLFLKAKKNFSSIEEIQSVSYILVNRQSILNFIGLDASTLRIKGLKIAKNQNFHQEKGAQKPYYFTHSTKLAESPVNIILRKYAIKAFALLHGTC